VTWLTARRGICSDCGKLELTAGGRCEPCFREISDRTQRKHSIRAALEELAARHVDEFFELLDEIEAAAKRAQNDREDPLKDAIESGLLSVKDHDGEAS
jgi:hypothetical protein